MSDLLRTSENVYWLSPGKIRYHWREPTPPFRDYVCYTIRIENYLVAVNIRPKVELALARRGDGALDAYLRMKAMRQIAKVKRGHKPNPFVAEEGHIITITYEEGKK